MSSRKEIQSLSFDLDAVSFEMRLSCLMASPFCAVLYLLDYTYGHKMPGEVWKIPTLIYVLIA